MKLVLMYPPSSGHLEQLRNLCPEAKFCIPSNDEEAFEHVREAEVILGNRYFLQSLPAANKLRWFQSNSVGVDLFLSDRTVRKGDFLFTNCRGVYDDELADHTLALLLGLIRGVHRCRDRQNKAQWEREGLPQLRGLKALIVGAGSLGSAVARRLNAFGVSCTGVRLHAGGELGPFRELCTDPALLRQTLGQSDIVILTLPLTALTHSMWNENLLSMIPDGAYLVNIGRGAILDESALRSHLPRFSGVGLDVFEQEPLPVDHWLWKQEKVIVSPHLGRSLEGVPRRFESLFVENLTRFLSERPLLNLVDRERGY